MAVGQFRPRGRAYIWLRDEKADGISGGTFTQDVWQTRDLNTKVLDESDDVMLAANQFTLQKGTYEIFAFAPGHRCGTHRVKLRNITDGTDEIIGQTGAATDTGAAGAANIMASLRGSFTITAAKTFELQHRCSSSRSSDGFGLASTFGVVEVYAEIHMRKVG